MKKWKFINTGAGWWLRITDVDQLAEFMETMGARFSHSVENVKHQCSNGKYQHYTNQLDSYLEVLYRTSGDSLLLTAHKLMIRCAEAYVKLLSQKGFININQHGGCNNEEYPDSVVLYRNVCIFPNYTENDLKIKTWENEDKKSGNIRTRHKYHYYAYIGDTQITDGDTVKWDTYEEAYNFAKQFILK